MQKMRENIAAGSFIGFVGSLLLFIYFSGEVIEPKLDNFLFTLIIWIICYSIFMLFGFKKEGMFGFVMGMYKILTEPNHTAEEKFHMLMSAVQQWLGIIADMSIVLETDKKKKEEVLPEIEPIE